MGFYGVGQGLNSLDILTTWNRVDSLSELRRRIRMESFTSGNGYDGKDIPVILYKAGILSMMTRALYNGFSSVAFGYLI